MDPIAIGPMPKNIIAKRESTKVISGLSPIIRNTIRYTLPNNINGNEIIFDLSNMILR